MTQAPEGINFATKLWWLSVTTKLVHLYNEATYSTVSIQVISIKMNAQYVNGLTHFNLFVNSGFLKFGTRQSHSQMDKVVK